MTNSRQAVSEQSLLYILLFAVAIMMVAIYNDYSADLFNQFEYEVSKTLGGLDRTLAGR